MRNILLILFAASCLSAQTEIGQLAGSITDASNLAVPSAAIAAKNIATGTVHATTSNASGSYFLAGLLPGVYDVTVEAKGFGKSVKRVEVTVGAKLSLDFRVEVGKEVVVVEVRGESGVAVNTETQTISQVIDSRQMTELPSLNRNPYDFVHTSGNVSDAGGNGAAGRGVGAVINGQRSSSTNILLDGVPNNDEFGAGVGQAVPIDSIQELSLSTSSFTAEFGRATGGIVNVATRSGTNTYHGTLYEFNRVSDMASGGFFNNANGLPVAVFTRNQFGYSVGGPVLPKLKNKLFFFQNTEWIRVRSLGNNIVWVPTPQLLAAADTATSDFFKAYGTRRPGLTSLGAFSRTQLIALDFDPCLGSTNRGACKSLSSSMPMFERATYSAPSDSGAGTPQNTYLLVGRLDYNWTDRTQVYFRYGLQSEAAAVGSNANSPYAGYDTANFQYNNSAALSMVHTINEHFVSQSKLSFNRFNSTQPLGTAPVGPTLYLGSGLSPGAFLGSQVAMPGYLPFSPGAALPFGGPQNFLQLNQDLTWTKGSHTLRFGGQVENLRDNRTFGAYENAVASFGPSFGKAMDNLVNGLEYQLQVAINPQGKFPGQTVKLPVGPPNFSRSNRYDEWAAYAQDAWKVTRHLTVNLGLRYEYFGVQHNANSALDSNFYPGSGSFFQGITSGVASPVSQSKIGGLWNPDYKNFGPRLGFAWDVFGNGSTSLRGGWGIGYERNFGNVTYNVIQNPPNYAVISVQAGANFPTIPVSTSNYGPLAGSSGSVPLPATSLRAVNNNIRTARAQIYNLVLEREILHGLLVALEYSGSKGAHLYDIANVNEFGTGNVYGGIPCTPGKTLGDFNNCIAALNTQYSNINYRSDGASSRYNSLNTRVEVRNIHLHGHPSGLTLRANYTWAHAMDDLSTTFSETANSFNLGYLNPFDPNQDYGNADFDIRHRLVISGIWDVPFAKHITGPAKFLLDGWSVAPIFVAQTGAPFSIYDCTLAVNACMRMQENAQMVSRTGAGASKPTGLPDDYNYMDLTAALPLAGTYVNPVVNFSDFGPFPANMTTRNYFRAPGQWNIDLGIHKDTKFGPEGRYDVQFRGELYNMVNHANLFAQQGNADVAEVSYVAAFKDGRRQVQFALKLVF